MDIRICQHKCTHKEDCEAYLASHGVGQKAEHSTLAVKSRSIEMGAA